MAPRTFAARRLTAALTRTAAGAKELGPIEAHERNVLAITRSLHTLAAKQRALTKQLADVRAQLRARRRELRAVLQRDASIGLDDTRLELAGTADAIDATTHRFEQKEK